VIFELEIILFFASVVLSIIISKFSDNFFHYLIFILLVATLMYYSSENLFKVLYFILMMITLLSAPIPKK